ncbi:hypothetical protein Pla163_27640 [Planctomycetes bacterium Pla163]|uniref:Uncharacterized protein n=1 Tax=Rohdeia mirabilis TaxID=2528008 RepID=A0A518D2C9_9BACT|nr:hypothetical protein Pla163_27640 [Planctomycetes bacterium Pla163]
MATVSDPRASRAPAWARNALLVGILTVLYAATFGPTTDGQILGNDAIHYAGAVASGDGAGLLLANHLLPHLAARGLFLIGTALGLLADDHAGALMAQTLISALGGALTVALVAATARRLCGPGPVATLVGFALATSSGLWLYAGVGETYAPAAAAETWVLFEVLRRLRAAEGTGDLRLIAALALATLVRQDAVLVAIVPLVVLGPRALAPVLVAGLASALGYALCFAATPAGTDAATWLVGVAAQPEWSASAERPALWFAGLVHGVLTLDAVAFGVHRTDALSAARVLASAAVLVHLVALAVAFARSHSPADASSSRFVLGLGAHLLVRFVFFAWFQPSNIEYAVGHLVPLALIAGWFWSRGDGFPRLVPVALAFQLSATLCLVVPLRTSGLADDARRVLEAGGEGGATVVTVEPFGELALARERYRRFGPARDAAAEQGLDFVDGSGSHVPEFAADVVARARTGREAGRSVLVALDRRLAAFLGLGAVEVPAPLASGLVELVDFETLDTGGALVAYRLPPALGGASR